MVGAAAASPDEVEVVEGRVRLENGEEVTRRYLKGKLLGKGGFAKCYLATCVDTGEQYALKVVSKASLQKSSARQRQLRTEVRIHRTLSHKHIVRFEHSFENDAHVYIVLELCPNKSMADLVKRRKRLEESEVVYYLLQLVSAVRHMHARGVIHRDLKLGNIFLDKELQCKVGDLGLSARCSKTERKQTLCGTPNYIAPEILDNTGHSFQVDLWSLGVVAYTMLVGRPPYECADIRSTYKRILANSYSFPIHVPLSESARHLIRSLLQTKPEHRPSLDEVELLPFLARAKPHVPRTLPLATLHQPPPSDWLVIPRHARTTTTTTKKPHVVDNGSADSPPGPITTTASRRSPAVVEPCTRRPLGLRDVNQVNGQQQHRAKLHHHNQADPAAVVKKADTGAVARLVPCSTRTVSSSSSSGGGRISPRAIAQQHEHHRRHRQAAMTTTSSSRPPVAAVRAVDEGRRTKAVVSTPLPTTSPSKPSVVASSSPTLARRSDRPRLASPPTTSTSPSGPVLPSALHSSSKKSSSPEGTMPRSSPACRPSTTRRAPPVQVSPSPPPPSPPRPAQQPAHRPGSSSSLPHDPAGGSGSKRRQAAAATTRSSPPTAGSRPRSSPEKDNGHGHGRAAQEAEPAGRRKATDTATTARAADPPASPALPPSVDALCPSNPLEVITRRLSRFLNEAASMQARRGRLPLPSHPPRLPTVLQPLAPKTWITRYCDFSQKYGVGYLLNNGCAGVFFNDSTKIVVDARGETATYLERYSRLCTPEKGREALTPPQQEQVFAMDSYPPELHKKVTLLRHFRKFLMEGGGVGGPSASSSPSKRQPGSTVEDEAGQGQCLYVKKWCKARSAVVFRLSSRVVQVIFSSGEEEVLITPDARVVMHVDSDGKRAAYSLAALVDAPVASIVKRLMHTNEVLKEVSRK